MFELPIIIIVTSITRIRCFRLEWLTLFGCFAELERFFRRLDLATPGNSRVGMFRQCGSCRCGRLGIGRPFRPNLDHRRHETPPRAAREKPGKYAVNRRNQLQRIRVHQHSPQPAVARNRPHARPTRPGAERSDRCLMSGANHSLRSPNTKPQCAHSHQSVYLRTGVSASL
jgi:hypothetical protein